MIIKARNTLADTAPRTYLSSVLAAGTNVMLWQNGNGFTADWAVQIGETNSDQTEIRLLSSGSPGGTAGTITVNTTYDHPANTPIYAIKYNQLVFERSTTGTAGTATVMSSGTITIQADSDVTIFDDTSGSITYAYKTFFRNSALIVNSTESDWIVITPSFYSLAVMRQRVKEKLWDDNYLTDPVIDNWINEWLFEMRNSAIAVNEDYALGTVDIRFGTAGLGTVTTADFKQIRRTDITYNGQDYFLATKMNINDFLPDEQFSSVHPYITWRGDTVFQVKPEESGGTARTTFYRIGTTLVNDTDELELPMRGYTKSFVDYAFAQALEKDGKIAEAQNKLVEAAVSKEQFTQQLSPRNKSGPTAIDVIEPVSGYDGWP